MPYRVPVIYVSHAITGPLNEGRHIYDLYVEHVREIGLEMSMFGLVPIVPILLHPELEVGQAVEMDYSLIRVSDGMLVCEDKWDSQGVKQEIIWAEDLHKPVFYSFQDLTEYEWRLS